VRKRWRWLLISLSALAVSVAALKAPSGDDAVAPAARAPDPKAEAARATLAQLPQRPGMGKMRSELFTAHSWVPPPAPPPSGPTQQPAPSAPPNPYRFAGTARVGGRLMILLARGDTLVEVKEGEPLEEVYQVRSASTEGVTLVYSPLGIEQQVPGLYAPDSASSGSSASPSQLPPGSPLAPPR
jgi:hypothetical protein